MCTLSSAEVALTAGVEHVSVSSKRVLDER
jgi:hypothetical protein